MNEAILSKKIKKLINQKQVIDVYITFGCVKQNDLETQSDMPTNRYLFQ